MTRSRRPKQQHSYDQSEFPLWRDTIRLGGRAAADKGPAIWDIKFYPQRTEEEDPVFAVVCNTTTTILRPIKKEDGYGVELLRCFELKVSASESLEEGLLHTLAWSQDEETGDPLICVAGASSIITIYNVKTGELKQTLVGHGGPITYLAVSPDSPRILFSASEDRQVRAWNLHRKYSKYPCGAIFLGEANKDHVLSVDVHSNGQWVLTGGSDGSVNLWRIPDDMEELPTLPEDQSDKEKVKMIHYPHFSTVQIHADAVDCARFYGDLILSRGARENGIILWKIENFETKDDLPIDPPASPYVNEPTKSAFGGKFQRLLLFNTPNSQVSYMRFHLFWQPKMSPILAMGDNQGSMLLWNLEMLEMEGEGGGSGGSGGGDELQSFGSMVETGTATRTAQSSEGAKAIQQVVKRKIDGPFKALEAHFRTRYPSRLPNKVQQWAVRHIATSSCGKWWVAVGEHGTVSVFSRWI